MISSTLSRIVYSGNGVTTAFVIPFTFYLNSDLIVSITTSAGVKTDQVLDTDYTISGTTITFVVAPANVSFVSIVRRIPVTQEVDYIPNTTFQAETHERALDKLTMICQYLSDIASRSLQLPASEDVGALVEVPAISARASTLLGFDANGDLTVMVLDPDSLELIAPISIGTAQLEANCVTTSKLATTLDLSGITLNVSTAHLVDASVTVAKLAASLDLHTKTIVLPSVLTAQANALTITGATVTAAAFVGSGAGLSGVRQADPLCFTLAPQNTQGGQRNSSAAAYFGTGDGTMVACGINTTYKLGRGTTVNTAMFAKSCFKEGLNAIDGVTNYLNGGTDAISKIYLRYDNAFVLTASGIVYAAGNNANGQLGQGNTTAHTCFKAIRFGASSSTNKAIVSLSCSSGVDSQCTVLAIDEDGQVWVWGYNGQGQLGINNTTNQSTPILLSASTATNAATFIAKVAIQTLVIGSNFGSSYILFNDGKIYSTGANGVGQLGIGNTTAQTNFVEVTTLSDIVQIYGAGYYDAGAVAQCSTMFARRAANTIYGTGYNGKGILGIGTTVNTNVLTIVTSLGAVDYFVTLGDVQGSCFAKQTATGFIKAWGDNGAGQLGNGNTTTPQSSLQTPTGLDALLTTHGGLVKIIGVGGNSTTGKCTLILCTDGTVLAAGNNTSGAMGLGDNAATTSNVFIASDLSHSLNTDLIPVGYETAGAAIALRSDKTAWACGSNASSQLSIGDASTADVFTPTRMKI